jgi:hypothetical protein
MSNHLTTTMQVPAHIAARIAARQQEHSKSALMSAVISGEGFPFPRISIRAGRFRLVEDGVETVVGINMDVVVVGVNPRVSKVFYGKPYDPAATDMRPDCFSNDGLKPDASVENPVCGNCVACPHNVLGSKVLPSGAKSKVCADQRHIAVVPAADPSKTYALTIPVSGMKGFREYFKDLNNYNIAPQEVVTELGFDTSTSYPKITFARKGFVPEKAIEKVDAIVASEEVKEITREVPINATRQLAAPAPTQAKPASIAAAVPAEPEPAPAPKVAKAPKPAPAPVVDEAYEEDEVVSGSTSLSQIEERLDDLFN